LRIRGSDGGLNRSDTEDDDVDDVGAVQAFHEAIKEKPNSAMSRATSS